MCPSNLVGSRQRTTQVRSAELSRKMSLCVLEWKRMLCALLVCMSIAEGVEVDIECHGASFKEVHNIQVMVANKPLIFLDDNGLKKTEIEAVFPVTNTKRDLLQGRLKFTLDIDYDTLPFLKCNMSGIKNRSTVVKIFEPQINLQNEVRKRIHINTFNYGGAKKLVFRIECTKALSTNNTITWGWQTKMKSNNNWKDAEPTQVRTESLGINENGYFTKTSLLVFGEMKVRCKLGDEERTVFVPSSTGDGYPSWLKVLVAVFVGIKFVMT